MDESLSHPIHPSIQSNLIHHNQATRKGKVEGGDARWVWAIDAMGIWHIMLGFWEHSSTTQALYQIKSSLQSACWGLLPIPSLCHSHHWPIPALPNSPKPQHSARARTHTHTNTHNLLTKKKTHTIYFI